MNNRQSLMEILLLSLDQSLGLQNVGKKAKKFLLRGEFCRTKTPIFRPFWKFSKVAILVEKYLCDNSAYRKNRVYHDEANGECKKCVILGQEDGWGKKPKQSFLCGQYCRKKTSFFELFRKFQNLMILIGKFHHEHSSSPIVRFSTTPLASIAGFLKIQNC